MAIPLILTSTSVERLLAPYFGKGYHLFVDNFYSTLTLFKHLYDQGVVATRTIFSSRHSFLPTLKKSQEWAKGWERQSMRWVRGPPCLVLQRVDNKVVSMITTVGNENEQGQVTCRVRTYGEWGERLSLKFLRPTTWKWMLLTGQNRSSILTRDSFKQLTIFQFPIIHSVCPPNFA